MQSRDFGASVNYSVATDERLVLWLLKFNDRISPRCWIVGCADILLRSVSQYLVLLRATNSPSCGRSQSVHHADVRSLV